MRIKNKKDTVVLFPFYFEVLKPAMHLRVEPFRIGLDKGISEIQKLNGTLTIFKGRMGTNFVKHNLPTFGIYVIPICVSSSKFTSYEKGFV